VEHRSRRPTHAFVALAMVVAATLGSSARAVAQQSGADGALPRGADPVHLDPADFTVDIDNRFWPMRPRTRWTSREVDSNGSQVDVKVTVTNRTKRIANGVVARVVRDTVTRKGVVVEDTLDWYAQDAAGNVWYLGERTAEFDRGKVSSRAGSWEAGVDGALPGIMVAANPEPGDAYRQEYSAGEAEDNAVVLAVDEQVEVPAGHFRGALLTEETNALEPRLVEYKLYAPGLGPVLAITVSGGGGREELLEITRVTTRAARGAGDAPLGAAYG
jgi:hypothetical protein